MMRDPGSQVDCQFQAGSIHPKFFFSALASHEFVFSNPRLVEVLLLVDNGAHICIDGPWKPEPDINTAPERTAIYRQQVLDGNLFAGSLHGKWRLHSYKIIQDTDVVSWRPRPTLIKGPIPLVLKKPQWNCRAEEQIARLDNRCFWFWTIWEWKTPAWQNTPIWSGNRQTQLCTRWTQVR